MDIHHAMIVHNKPNRLYEALTQQHDLEVWMGASTVAQTEVGGALEFRFKQGQRTLKLEVIHLETEKQIQWRVVQPVWPIDLGGQVITWTLTPYEVNTLVDFRMEGWPQDDDVYASVSYKWASFMMRLKIYMGDTREIGTLAPSAMPLAVNIRPLVDTEAEALAAFYNALSSETIRTFRPLREKTTAEVCERLIADNQTGARHRYDLLAEDSRGITGWAFLADLQTDRPYLGIVVGEAHQRRGIGKALMERLYNWADEQAIAKTYLMVVKDNDRARQLYQQFGFAVYDEEFDELDQLDYVHMVRSLKGHNGS